MMWHTLLPTFVFAHCIAFGLAGPSSRPYGTFQSPAARARPRFRYWLPDASVDADIVKSSIKAAGDRGIGGVEFLPFYNYGGGAPVGDWSTYGFGTPAFQKLFRAALESHRDNDLIMDFALGPNQGQGVPTSVDDEGLQWDLVTSSAVVPADGSFNGTLPGWGAGNLVAAVSALVISSTNLTIPPQGGTGPPTNYTQLMLKHDTLTDHSDKVSNLDGILNHQFPGGNGSYRLFASYEVRTLAKNLDPEKSLSSNIFDNGSYLVDHFSAHGAQTVTKFWEEYILTDGVKELLSEAGNSAWEDSMELLSNVSWSPTLPSRFQQIWGYSLKQFLPLIIFGNNNINIQSSIPGSLQCVLDTEDQGMGYVNDYRVALAKGYQEYLDVFTNWTKAYLDLQHSSQISYNLPMDMEASIPYDDVPECESLQFRDNVDSYRQFSGVAYLAEKNVVSIELGAAFGLAFEYTLPNLLFAMNRAASGGVNQYIIHGQQYPGNYPNTTWPGYVSFGYHVSEQYSEKQPDWSHGLEAALRYMGRIGYVQQQGVARIDVAMYNRQSATDPIVHTLYLPDDLQSEGWSYAYLSPDNFKLPQATVSAGILAPTGPAFKAIVVENTQNMTLDGVNYLQQYASQGVPIILSRGVPGYYPSGNSSDERAVLEGVSKLVAADNVYGVGEGDVARTLRALGLAPRVGVETNGTWYTTWREDTSAGTDYAYVFCDIEASSGTLTVASTKTPYLFDAWTGLQTPILHHQQSGNTTIIPLSLAGNQTAIIAFADQEANNSLPAVPSFHITSLTSEVLGYSYNNSSETIALHVPASFSSGFATLSSGQKISLNGSNVPNAFELSNWTLTAEHWEAPANFSDASVIADKHNTTHQLQSLTSWRNIPGLVNASGLGYYSTEFDWPPQGFEPGGALGAYIYFSDILHAITVYINGERLPPLDYTNARADITSYLHDGSNSVLAVVPTTMWNYVRSLLPEIVNGGSPVRFADGPFSSLSPPNDNGLVGMASVIPYKVVEVGADMDDVE